MTQRQQRWGAGAIVVAVLVAQPGSATVQSVSWNATGQSQATLPWFDARLGRLTSVTAEASYASLLPLSRSNVPFDYALPAMGVATLANISFAVAGTATLQQQAGYWLFSVNESGNATWTDATQLARFYGTSGTISGAVTSSAYAPGTVMVGNYVPVINYKISYTYDDAPAVPEPATWAMMVGGFTLLGVALRLARRRRSAGGEIATEA